MARKGRRHPQPRRESVVVAALLCLIIGAGCQATRSTNCCSTIDRLVGRWDADFDSMVAWMSEHESAMGSEWRRSEAGREAMRDQAIVEAWGNRHSLLFEKDNLGRLVMRSSGITTRFRWWLEGDRINVSREDGVQMWVEWNEDELRHKKTVFRRYMGIPLEIPVAVLRYRQRPAESPPPLDKGDTR